MTAYTWTPFGAGKIWITAPTGEAGAFDAAEFDAILTAGRLAGNEQAAISRFFWENF